MCVQEKKRKCETRCRTTRRIQGDRTLIYQTTECASQQRHHESQTVSTCSAEDESKTAIYHQPYLNTYTRAHTHTDFNTTRPTDFPSSWCTNFYFSYRHYRIETCRRGNAPTNQAANRLLKDFFFKSFSSFAPVRVKK